MGRKRLKEDGFQSIPNGFQKFPKVSKAEVRSGNTQGNAQVSHGHLKNSRIPQKKIIKSPDGKGVSAQQKTNSKKRTAKNITRSDKTNTLIHATYH